MDIALRCDESDVVVPGCSRTPCSCSSQEASLCCHTLARGPRSSTPQGHVPPHYTMAHAPHKNWRDLTQDEYFERQVLAEPDPARKREMREGQVETLRLRAENEKKFGPTPPPPPPPPADPNQHRIQILEAKEKRATDPRVRNNIRGVIRDYQNGALDLNKRRDPYHCAMYWDGVLMRGWASVDDDYFAEEPYRWRVAVPGGKLWIEDVRSTSFPISRFS
ncbi:hypothetical protein BJ508DRAFT_85011 [Ascobolus immersus RN42]|uniref:Uncharacterized protein n=1 Tax=Ascobolus immersus RN42 TaxID=1160509 RepID=A0A3N4HQ83_ASCIM|nr:hypothetical protein BJ508DRAFT_85011 [Ascobolus immersus RN42]